VYMPGKDLQSGFHYNMSLVNWNYFASINEPYHYPGKERMRQ